MQGTKSPKRSVRTVDLNRRHREGFHTHASMAEEKKGSGRRGHCGRPPTVMQIASPRRLPTRPRLCLAGRHPTLQRGVRAWEVPGNGRPRSRGAVHGRSGRPRQPPAVPESESGGPAASVRQTRASQRLNAQTLLNFKISSLCDCKVTFLQSWGPELGPLSIPRWPEEAPLPSPRPGPRVLAVERT